MTFPKLEYEPLECEPKDGAIQTVSTPAGGLSYDHARWFLRSLQGHWIFRGQEKDWPPEPVAARYFSPSGERLDPATLQRMVEWFREESFRLGYVTDWDVHLHDAGVFSDEGRKKRVGLLEELKWEMLAQHYGVPTRLLDWSGSYQAALFFAYGGWSNKRLDASAAPVVWCLERDKMKTGGEKIDRDINDQQPPETAYERYLFDYEEAVHILHQNELVNPRQRAQRGWFTFCKKWETVDEHVRKHPDDFVSATMYKVVLRREDEQAALFDLECGNTSAGVIRHDLEGVACDAVNLFLRFAYEYKKVDLRP